MKAVLKMGLVSILLIATLKAYSQDVPYFETKFYFEDAIGNKDSLTLGYDKQIDPHNLNSNFGEIELATPFDSVFEVRAFHLGDLQEAMSKKIIGFAEDYGPYLVSSQTLIITRILHKPLKVSYDVTRFSKEARSGSFLTHTSTKNLQGPQYIKEWEFFCLSDVDHHFFTFPDSIYSIDNQVGYYRIYDIEGGTTDTLYGIEIGFRPYNCLFPTVTENLKYEQLKSYPTVSFDNVNVLLPEQDDLQNIKIVSLYGNSMKVPVSENGNYITIDVTSLGTGMYLGVVNDNYYFKFIKQ